MFGPRAQPPENPGNQRPRVARLAHDIVEPACNRRTPLVAGRRRRDNGDEHPMAEAGFGAHAGRQHRDAFHVTDYHDDDFEAHDEVVVWPLERLVHVEADLLKRLTLRRFGAAVDDED